MADQNELTVADVARTSRVREVIELMLGDEHLNQKQACERVGISEKTFNRGIAAEPDLVKQIHVVISNKLIDKFDAMTDVHSDVMETLKDEANRIRKLLERIGELNFKERMNAINALMKIDKYIMNVLSTMYPKLKDSRELAPVDNRNDDQEANRIFATMTGANLKTVTLSKQVLVFEETERKAPPESIVEGEEVKD